MWMLVLCLTAELQMSTMPSDESNFTNEFNESFTTNACDTNDSLCTTVTPTNSTIMGTSINTTAMPSEMAATKSDSMICSCDLQRKFCDINCCCDQDCSFEDKKVFKTCLQESNFKRDSSFCQYMDYIYINNTPYKWEVNQNGLFCIVKTNLPSRYTVQVEQTINSLEDAAMQKQKIYSWSNVDGVQRRVDFNSSEEFIYGSNVWVVRNKMMQLFQLPDSFITNMCLIKRNMKFLQNFKSKCSQSQIGENIIELHAEFYFKDLYVVRTPNLFKEEYLKGCPKNVCLSIDVKICNEHYDECTAHSGTEKLRFFCHSDKRICFNLTQKVRYNFYHNGTRGFSKIELLLVLANVSRYTDRNDFEFPQEFEVNYFWSNFSKNHSLVMSGNPGYLIGKPLLIGRLVTDNATNVTRDRIERSSIDLKDNFLLFPSSQRSICILNNHAHVLSEFGYNMMVKCRIRTVLDYKNISASNVCKNLQRKIFQYWPIFYTDGNFTTMVGSFGNANESTVNDWLKVLTNKEPANILNSTMGNFTENNATIICHNFMTVLKIDVFHARVDLKTLVNQEKVIAVVFTFGTNNSYEFAIDNDVVIFDVAIREEIMYLDITSERIERFVEPSSFKVTLPYDFFYPFIKVGNEANGRSLCTFLIFMQSLFFLGNLT